MKIIKTANKNYLQLTESDWLHIGKVAGWFIVDAKKKKTWIYNPFAVCTKSVGREDKAKYERCVMDVKKKQK